VSAEAFFGRQPELRFTEAVDDGPTWLGRDVVVDGVGVNDIEIRNVSIAFHARFLGLPTSEELIFETGGNTSRSYIDLT
jgi:hypothetical protein